uniref:Uncharacterized protein n=1 Tax=Xanthomonas phage MK21 TaxID=3148942 RepID=A0AAU7J862_9CAUD
MSDLNEAVVRLEQAYTASMDEEYRDDLRTVLDALSVQTQPSAVADWRIDTSAGGPILVYKDCSVIEGEDARYVLGLIERDQSSVCCGADGIKNIETPKP